MVTWRVVLASRMLMTGCAEPIIRKLDFGCMGIMTITATDALIEHLALQIRTVHVDFIHDLPIIVVGFRTQQFIRVKIIKLLAGTKVRMHDTAPRMAGSTGLDLRWRFLVLESR